MRTAEQILQSIIIDVEAMRAQAPHDMRGFGDPEEEEHWMGGFEAFYVDEHKGALIQWPNLGILIEEAKLLQ